MPLPIVPTVRQYGFSTGSGSLASIVDGNASVGWAPLTTRFDTYTDEFTIGTITFRGAKAGVEATLNVGKPFPCLEFDYGGPVRLPAFLLQVETSLTLGAACLLSSNNPASSVANVIQTDDVLLGLYTATEICRGLILLTNALQQDIKGRYVRLLQRTTVG